MNVALIARSTLFTQPGGDTFQVRHTAGGLEALGHSVHIVLAGEPLPKGIELIHGFNLGRPADLIPYFKSFKGKKVLSTVYVDYSLGDKIRAPFLHNVLGSHGLEWIKTILRGLNGSDRFPSASYLLNGQRRSMSFLLSKSDRIITSSMSELERINAWSKLSGKELRDKHHLVPLGISNAFLEQQRLKEDRKGLLMVGRLEYLKNQRAIIRWAAEENWPLTVVGDANVNQKEYYLMCKAEAGPMTTFLPYTSTEKIIELMDQHACLVIPSLFETYSLVGWEGFARGMNVVANEAPDMNETLAPVATLADINDAEAFKTAIREALNEPLGQKKSQTVLEQYAWDHIVRRIFVAYR